MDTPREAAGEARVGIGAGVSVIRQYLAADQIDEMHLAISAVLLGAGEHLLQGINLNKLGFCCGSGKLGEKAMHVFLRKTCVPIEQLQ